MKTATVSSTRATAQPLKSTRYAWVVMALCASLLFYKYILQVYPGIMTQTLMQVFHITGVDLGHLAASFFYTYLVTQLFVGVLLDKWSVRYLAAGAVAVSALGAYVFSVATVLWEAEVARGLMGFGAAFATVSYLKMAAVWFPPQRFAVVGGLLTTAVMLGAVFGEAPLALLMHAQGWRHSLMLCAVLGLVIAILFALIVRDRPRELQAVLEQKVREPFYPKLKAALVKPQNWLITFYGGLAFAPMAVFSGLWGNPFLQEAYQLSPAAAASMITLAFLGLAAGGPGCGWFADRYWGRKPVLVGGTLLSLLSLTAVLYVSGLPVWIVGTLLFLFGFGTGAFMLSFALVTALNDLSLAATVIAMVNTGDALLSALTEPLIGKFLDMRWDGKTVEGVHVFALSDYHIALGVLPVYLVTAVALALLLKAAPARRLAQ